METKEYYGGTYPSPKYEDEKKIKARVTISFNIETIVPLDWNEEEILEDVKILSGIYHQRKNEEIVDIEYEVVE